MAFAPIKRWKLPYITRWESFQNRNPPIISADEVTFQPGLGSPLVKTPLALPIAGKPQAPNLSTSAMEADINIKTSRLGVPDTLQPPPIPHPQLLQRIGRGSYGEVWLARSVTGAYRAVKIVHRQAFDHDRPFEREFNGIVRFEPISRGHESQVDILHVGRGESCFF